MEKVETKRRLISAGLGVLLLFSVLSVRSHPNGPFRDDGSAYCPLQKVWVKRSIDAAPKRHNLLSQLCMRDTVKQNLAIEISLKSAFGINEKGVFETLKNGVRNLDNYKEFPNPPQHNLSKLTHTFSILSGKNDLRNDIEIKSQAFTFEQLSRPPTPKRSKRFCFHLVRALTKISHNINPRSPPPSFI